MNWSAVIGNCKIGLGDCLELMEDIPAKSIDLTVTSPPYDNLRTYNGSLEWGEHVWKPVLEKLFYVTKDGGVVVWIVNDATVNGSETGTSFRQALYAKEIGFNLHDTMIWNKGCFTGVGSVRVRYGPATEYMFVFSKGKPKTFNAIKDRKNIHAGTIGKSDTVRLPNGEMLRKTHQGKRMGEYGIRFNVWNISPEMSNINRVHPAQFPMKLVRDHVTSWSNAGDTVFDPFMGSGTTGVASLELGRNFVGIEKDESYFYTATNKITKAMEARCQE